MKKLLMVLMTVALVGGLCGSALAAGAVVKEFKIKAADGTEFTQEQLKGQKTLLVFAQMACRQCRTELKELEEAKADLKDKKVYVILVDMNTDAAVTAWGKVGYTMPLLLDPDFKVAEMLGLRSTPSTVIVDKDLKVVYEKTGYKSGDVDTILEQL